MNFMNSDHPDAFVDFPPKKEIPPNHYECKQCKGHGGWNLQLNAYPLRGKEETPENRHNYSHFRASCFNCFGWGYTEDHCNHNWDNGVNVGRCLHLYTCTLCGKKREVDSSD
jgi:hypothetical protein